MAPSELFAIIVAANLTSTGCALLIKRIWPKPVQQRVIHIAHNPQDDHVTRADVAKMVKEAHGDHVTWADLDEMRKEVQGAPVPAKSNLPTESQLIEEQLAANRRKFVPVGF